MPAPRVVAIQFDGLRADALSEENTPHLAAAAGRGTWFQAHRSTFPTSTRVCVSTLATGAHPRAHGLPGNSALARALGRTITTGSQADLAEWECALDGRLLERDTFFARTGGAVVSVASSGSAWLWSAGRAARLAHPDIVHPAEGREAVRTEAIPPAAEPDLARCAWALDTALHCAFAEPTPRVLLVHLSEPDNTQHHQGAAGPEYLEALRGVDELFGAFWEKFRERHASRETHLVLFSDHGVVATAGGIDLDAELEVLPGRGETWEVAHSEGAALFYAQDKRALPALVDLLRTKEWAGPLFSADGAGAEGRLPGTTSLGLVGCGGPRAPDLLMGFQWGDGHPAGASRAGALPGWGYSSVRNKGTGGTHGSCSPYELRNFLIAVGPAFGAGVRIDAPTGNADLAPTILTLAGEKPPPGLDGQSLTQTPRGRGEERIYRVESRGCVQTLSRTEVEGRFYLNYARLERG